MADCLTLLRKASGYGAKLRIDQLAAPFRESMFQRTLEQCTGLADLRGKNPDLDDATRLNLEHKVEEAARLGSEYENAFSAICDAKGIAKGSPVAEVPAPCPPAVLERLLDAQFFFKDTRGFTFSYQRETGAVLLHATLHTAALDPASLENAVGNMLFVSRRFPGEIAALLSESGADQGRSRGGEGSDVLQALMNNAVSC